MNCDIPLPLEKLRWFQKKLGLEEGELAKVKSHQVRNPLTVIGGSILKLKRDAEPGSPVHKVYDAILEENRRLENMVMDVGVYTEMFQKEPQFSDIGLGEIISKVLGTLKGTHSAKMAGIHVRIDPLSSRVQGDPGDMEKMFHYLLQNSIEAADQENPDIRISSEIWKQDPRFVQVKIFNNGTPPSPEDMPHLFVPFYSSKAYGTGFGLPISQLAARKNLGELFIEALPGEGTRCVIRLPALLGEEIEK